MAHQLVAIGQPAGADARGELALELLEIVGDRVDAEVAEGPGALAAVDQHGHRLERGVAADRLERRAGGARRAGDHDGVHAPAASRRGEPLGRLARVPARLESGNQRGSPATDNENTPAHRVVS